MNKDMKALEEVIIDLQVKIGDAGLANCGLNNRANITKELNKTLDLSKEAMRLFMKIQAAWEIQQKRIDLLAQSGEVLDREVITPILNEGASPSLSATKDMKIEVRIEAAARGIAKTMGITKEVDTTFWEQRRKEAKAALKAAGIDELLEDNRKMQEAAEIYRDTDVGCRCYDIEPQDAEKLEIAKQILAQTGN